MAYCNFGGHRCAQTPISVYYAFSTDARFTKERWRIRACVRHGRATLERLYRRGLDLEVEGSEPEFCLGCGLPASTAVVEVSLYEGEWAARFAGVVCDACDPADPETVGAPLVGAEKLPPREKSTKRARQA